MTTTGKRTRGRSLGALTTSLVLAVVAVLLLSGTALAATPGRPTGTAPKGTIATRTPTFKWVKVAGATFYEVRIYQGSAQVLKKTGITRLSWKSSKALPTKVSLTWKVRASNARGTGVWSRSFTFKVVTTPRPVCTSSAGFSYQVGACTKGSGKADIGPFTPPGSWSVSIRLSGQAISGDDCASTVIGMIVEAQGAAGSEIAAGFGPAMTAHFSAKLAPLHLIFDPSGCSWTATFN